MSYTIQRPSGDHRGCSTPSAYGVSCRTSVPSASVTNSASCSVAGSMRPNTIRVPSGEYSGSTSKVVESGPKSGRARLPSDRITHREVKNSSWAGSYRSKTTCRPSGE